MTNVETTQMDISYEKRMRSRIETGEGQQQGERRQCNLPVEGGKTVREKFGGVYVTETRVAKGLRRQCFME